MFALLLAYFQQTETIRCIVAIIMDNEYEAKILEESIVYFRKYHYTVMASSFKTICTVLCRTVRRLARA